MATTIGVVATDAVLTKTQCGKLATMAHDGLARTIDPVHTMADGDTLFALATGASGRPGRPDRAGRAGRRGGGARRAQRRGPACHATSVAPERTRTGDPMIRRQALWTLAAAVLLGACSTPAPPPAPPPIVFVHGNGDSAALWTTTLWRFESNGWPRDKLHAIDLPLPAGARRRQRAAARPQFDHRARAVPGGRGRRCWPAPAPARWCWWATRAAATPSATTCRTSAARPRCRMPCWAARPTMACGPTKDFRPNNEFNGAGPFLKGVNAPKGPNGDEVTPGLRWMTLRSDNNDKFAQPDGVWIGAGQADERHFDGPALKGAKNVVLPARPPRGELPPEAFAQTYQFITGRAPATLVLTRGAVVLDGKLSGIGAGGPSNLPLAGRHAGGVCRRPRHRRSAAANRCTRKTVVPTAAGGRSRRQRQGLPSSSSSVPGYATTHVYRSPSRARADVVHFARSGWPRPTRTPRRW
jgi:triacylglycerol lipase